MGNKDVRRRESKKVKKEKRKDQAVNPISVTQPVVEVVSKSKTSKVPKE